MHYYQHFIIKQIKFKIAIKNTSMGSYFLSLLKSLSFPSTSQLLLISFLLFIIIIIYLIRKYGYFDHATFEQDILPSSTALYLNHKCNYSKIGSIFDKINSDMKNTFHISNCFGIYYDNPHEIPDPYLCRSTVGVLVNVGQDKKIEDFLINHPQYKKVRFPTTRCIKSSHCYVNVLSFFIIPAKIYPKMTEFMKKNDYQNYGPIIEYYNFLSSEKSVIMYAPIENNDRFFLWND